MDNFNDKSVLLIKRIKTTRFSNGHRYKQCYLEPDKIISDKFICNLPCDLYCPNTVKVLPE